MSLNEYNFLELTVFGLGGGSGITGGGGGGEGGTAVQKARNGDIRFQFPSANTTSRLTRPLARADSLCERVQFVRL